MLAVLASGVMEPELNSESSHVGILKQEHGTATQSCSTQASAWGMDDPVSNTYKRPLSNGKTETQVLRFSETLPRMFATGLAYFYQMCSLRDMLSTFL